MKKYGPAKKNPCKICFQKVTKKNGIRCQGACKKWIHFCCLQLAPDKINDVKARLITLVCPCPDCDSKSKEVIVNPRYRSKKKICPAYDTPILQPLANFRNCQGKEHCNQTVVMFDEVPAKTQEEICNSDVIIRIEDYNSDETCPIIPKRSPEQLPVPSNVSDITCKTQQRSTITDCTDKINVEGVTKTSSKQLITPNNKHDIILETMKSNKKDWAGDTNPQELTKTNRIDIPLNISPNKHRNDHDDSKEKCSPHKVTIRLKLLPTPEIDTTKSFKEKHTETGHKEKEIQENCEERQSNEKLFSKDLLSDSQDNNQLTESASCHCGSICSESSCNGKCLKKKDDSVNMSPDSVEHPVEKDSDSCRQSVVHALEQMGNAVGLLSNQIKEIMCKIMEQYR